MAILKQLKLTKDCICCWVILILKEISEPGFGGLHPEGEEAIPKIYKLIYETFILLKFKFSILVMNIHSSLLSLNPESRSHRVRKQSEYLPIYLDMLCPITNTMSNTELLTCEQRSNVLRWKVNFIIGMKITMMMMIWSYQNMSYQNGWLAESDSGLTNRVRASLFRNSGHWRTLVETPIVWD